MNQCERVKYAVDLTVIVFMGGVVFVGVLSLNGVGRDLLAERALVNMAGVRMRRLSGLQKNESHDDKGQ